MNWKSMLSSARNSKLSRQFSLCVICPNSGSTILRIQAAITHCAKCYKSNPNSNNLQSLKSTISNSLGSCGWLAPSTCSTLTSTTASLCKTGILRRWPSSAPTSGNSMSLGAMASPPRVQDLSFKIASICKTY